jgi:hypothetical protein
MVLGPPDGLPGAATVVLTTVYLSSGAEVVLGGSGHLVAVAPDF